MGYYIMIKLFQIFSNATEMDKTNKSINELLGYLNPEKNRYRPDSNMEGITKHYEKDLWAAVVSDELTEACTKMAPAEKLKYYDDSDLKTYQWLVENNWYKPEEGSS